MGSAMLILFAFVSIMLLIFTLFAAAAVWFPRTKPIDRRLALIGLAVPGILSSASTNLLKAEKVASFVRIEGLLKRFQFSHRLQLWILQANSKTSVGALVLQSLMLGAAGFAVAWYFAPMVLVALFAGASFGSLPYASLSFKRSRRINAFNAALADSIDTMSRALRAGYSLGGAIEMLGENAPEPARTEFREVFKQQNLGLPLRDALMQLLERIPSADLRVLMTAILIQRDTGGNLVEILDRTANVIRERIRIEGEIRIHTAQGRLTAWILSLLPVLLLLLINIVDPGYSHVLLYEPVGRRLIYIAIGLLATGSFLIHRIINGIEV
jgi:tight adherence protein B